MALDIEKQSQMVGDYFRNGDANDIPFGRSYDERQSFFNWFGEAASQWPKSEESALSFSEYTHPGACFANAQRKALESEMEYCEGFYKIPGRSYYVHGFNLHNGKAIDFTNSNNKSTVDIEYYGVVIPDVFIREYNPGVEIGKGDSIGSLLYQYYLDTH